MNRIEKTKFMLKTLAVTVTSLGLVAGSLVAPLVNAGKVQAANTLDFTKQVDIAGTNNYTQSVSPAATDTMYVRIYVYNTTPGTTLHNGRLTDTISTSASGTVSDTATIYTDEVSYTSTTSVVVPTGKRLDYIPQTTKVYSFNDNQGTSIGDVNGLNPLTAGQGYNIGDIPGDNPSSPVGNAKHWYVYQLRLVDASTPVVTPAPSLDLVKTIDKTTIASGEVATFKIWVHNGVTGSVAKNEVLKDSLNMAFGTTHADTATLTTTNTNSLSASAQLNTAANLGLTYVPGSTKIIDHNGNVTAVADVNGTSPLFTDAGLSLGDQQGCFEFEKFVTFQVTTVTAPITTISTPTPAPQKGQVLAAATSLPNTGPEQGVQLLLAGLVPAGMLLRKLRIK